MCAALVAYRRPISMAGKTLVSGWAHGELLDSGCGGTGTILRQLEVLRLDDFARAAHVHDEHELALPGPRNEEIEVGGRPASLIAIVPALFLEVAFEGFVDRVDDVTKLGRYFLRRCGIAARTPNRVDAGPLGERAHRVIQRLLRRIREAARRDPGRHRPHPVTFDHDFHVDLAVPGGYFR